MNSIRDVFVPAGDSAGCVAAGDSQSVLWAAGVLLFMAMVRRHRER